MAVVGGGISGLATAWFLRSRGGEQAPEVTLLEAGPRLGGKILTSQLEGLPVEGGPDSFLARVPDAAELCREVGLGEELVAPAATRAFVWSRGGLRPLPEGLVLGVPSDLVGLARSGVVSPAGVARAGLDLVLPRRRQPSDPSVAEVVGGRLGREVVERVLDPLLGGIHAGRCDRLSLASTAPQVAEAARASRSLLLGLRRRAPAPGEAGPVFLTVAGGLGRLVERLADRLAALGVEVRTGAPVRSLVPAPGGGWELECEGAPALSARAVVVTLPAFAAAALLEAAVPEAARELAAVEYASVVVAVLAYRPADVAHPLDGAGFLVPRVEGRMVTACSWFTSKWPHLAAGAGAGAGAGHNGLTVLRASAGRAGDDRALDLDDDTLVRRVHAELAQALDLRAPPVTARVFRWPRSLPQYQVGHRERVHRVEAAVAARPGLVLAGAAYRGLGIAACVRQAEDAAASVLGHLAHG